MICAACGVARDPADLLAFWPIGRPALRRFVCRPTRPSPKAFDACFRRVVRTSDLDAIGLATRAAGGPVRPGLEYSVGERGPELLMAQR